MLHHSITLDTSIYSVEAIKKAAYRFADKVSVIIGPGSGSTVSVLFNFSTKQMRCDAEQVVADFCNELLDQDLRERIKKETEPVRNLLLAHAFSRTGLTDKSQT